MRGGDKAAGNSNLNHRHGRLNEQMAGAVKTDFGSFAKVLEHTQEKLRQASDSIDSAFVRTRSIEKRLRSVEALEETETEKYLPTDSQE